YVGIKVFNSDYAFTVTNVLIHGVPYLALVCIYGQRQQATRGPGILREIFSRGPALFLGLLWAVAYLEELVWDRAVWQEHSWLFGAPWEVGALQGILVPLLALPQLTHYLLDGFIWKRSKNPEVTEALRVG